MLSLEDFLNSTQDEVEAPSPHSNRNLAKKPRLQDPVEHLSAFQRRLAHLVAAGVATKDIAAWMETTEAHISKHIGHPAVQRLVFKLTALMTDDLRPAIERVNERISEHANEAFEVELELMRNMRDRQGDIKAAGLCFTVAKDLLDRAGAAQPKRIETKNLNANLSGEDIKSLRDTLEELDGF